MHTALILPTVIDMQHKIQDTQIWAMHVTTHATRMHKATDLRIEHWLRSSSSWMAVVICRPSLGCNFRSQHQTVQHFSFCESPFIPIFKSVYKRLVNPACQPQMRNFAWCELCTIPTQLSMRPTSNLICCQFKVSSNTLKVAHVARQLNCCTRQLNKNTLVLIVSGLAPHM